MPWNTIRTATPGSPALSDYWNTDARDNLNYIHATVERYSANVSGTALAAGDVVIWSGTANNQITTVGGSAGYTGTDIGVLMDTSVAAGGTAWARLGGYVATVKVTGAVARGDLLQHSGTATYAQVGSTGAFARALSANASGTAFVEARLFGNQQVAASMSFATPAITLGTAHAAGTATTAIRSDATILAFGTALPGTMTAGGAGTAGTAALTAHIDHKHPFTALVIGDLPQQPYCSLRRTSAKSLTGGAGFTRVEFNGGVASEIADPQAMHGTAVSADDSKITVPSGATGWFLIVASTQWNNVTGNKQLAVYKNGTIYVNVQSVGDATNTTTLINIFQDAASAGDYYEMYAAVGTNSDMIANSVNFSVARLTS